METFTLKLPDNLVREAARLASAEEVTIGHLVRRLLAREVERRLDPETPAGVESALVAALQTLFARDLVEAEDWDDLACRLRRHGYDLRPAETGLALYKTSCGTKVCSGADIGVDHKSLVQRFGAGMPGHSHGTSDAGPARGTVVVDERARLHSALEPVFRTAEDWESLVLRLARRGCVLRAQGRGLAIYATAGGRHICNTATVGYRYRALVKKFGGPMPGHLYGADWVRGTPDDEPAFEVIERG